jgi:hypothetical protein
VTDCICCAFDIQRPNPFTPDCRPAMLHLVGGWLVNFFEHHDAATAWAMEHGVHGTAVPLAEATNRGKAAWRRWIADDDRPAGQAGGRP